VFGIPLDTTMAANPDVAALRNQFEQHLDECRDCQPTLCFQANVLWRKVCLTALRVQTAAKAGV
jgi:hypothetical protein